MKASGDPQEVRTAERPVALCVQAVVLLAGYALAAPWLVHWCYGRFGNGLGTQLLAEASGLAVAGLLAALFGGDILRSWNSGRARGRWSAGLPAASLALAVLGMLALALRLFDRGYDDQDLWLRALDTPKAVAAFLMVLPFGVAAEQIVFRSCQGRLRAALGRAPSVVAAGLAFATFHWIPGLPLDRHQTETMIYTLAGGLVLAALYERTASLPLLIGLHLAYDILAVAQSWLNVRHARDAEAGLFLVWLAGAAGLAWGLRGIGGMGAPSPAGESAARSPAGLTEQSAVWLAALMFGCGLPVLLAWIRFRFGL